MTQTLKIARHHLGDRVWLVERVSDGWAILVNPVDGPLFQVVRPTVDAAAADGASQLRAAGWSPSHARLEWEHHTANGTHTLNMLMDGAALNVAVIMSIEQVLTQKRHYYVDIQTRRWRRSRRDSKFDSLEDAVAHVTEWCTTVLPSLHIPPFPETPHANE